MLRFRRASVAALIGLVAALSWAIPAGAVEEAVSDIVIIRDGDVVSGDLLAGGNKLLIRGIIEGDLVATAFEVIEVEGTVAGDLIAVAPRIEIRGTVGGSVRALSMRTIIDGRVGGDVIVAGGTLRVTGVVTDDARASVVAAHNDGEIGGDLVLRAFRATVEGVVVGDLEGSVRSLTVGGEATIGGDVVVRGRADIADSAEIGGRARSPDASAVPLRARSYGVLGVLVALSIWLLAGPAVLWVAPAWLDRHRGRPVIGRWVGAGSFALVGAVAVIGGLGALTAASSGEGAVVLGVVTAVLALSAIVLIAIAALLGAVPAAMQIGGYLGSPSGPVSAHVRGVVAVTALAWVPVIGGWVVAAFLVVAMGATIVRRPASAGDTEA